jgi:hypothetical protein
MSRALRQCLQQASEAYGNARGHASVPKDIKVQVGILSSDQIHCPLTDVDESAGMKMCKLPPTVYEGPQST